MTKEAAQKQVQANLAKVKALMDESAVLMDEHGFTASVGSLDYIPRNQPYDEDEGVLGMYFEDGESAYHKYYAGKWLPSATYLGC